MVNGTMDVKNLAPYLKEKLKRSVEVVPPKKEEGGGEKKEKDGGQDKKSKEGGGSEKKEGGGGEKKEGGSEKKDGVESKVEVNKIEYSGYSPYLSYYTMPVHDQGYVDQGYGNSHYNQGYVNPVYMNPGYCQCYPNHGHVVEYSYPPPPPPSYVHAPQIFSDENPNACSVM